MDGKRIYRVTKNGFRFDVTSVQRMEKIRSILLRITRISPAQLDANGRLYEEAMEHYTELRDSEELLAMFPDPSKFKVFIEVALAKWCGRVNLYQMQRAREIINQVRHYNGEITQERFYRAVQLAKSEKIPERILREITRCARASEVSRSRKTKMRYNLVSGEDQQTGQRAELYLTVREVEMIKLLRQQYEQQNAAQPNSPMALAADVPAEKPTASLQEKAIINAANGESTDTEMLANMMRYLRT